VTAATAAGAAFSISPVTAAPAETLMPPTTRRARADWAFSHVFALPEMWAIVAEHRGVVGAWRLTGVCVAARVGAKEWLRTLPGLVVCGGRTVGAVRTSEVWKLDLAELQWARMPDLTFGRDHHACCAVRGGVVVLGGFVEPEEVAGEATVASVETLEAGESMVKALPPLSSGPVACSAVVAIDESESEQGQVLLIGGWTVEEGALSAVHKVDLATGVCTPQPPLLSRHGTLYGCSAARLADGRIVCVGSNHPGSLEGMAQVLEPPEDGTPSEAVEVGCGGWLWRYLPAMSAKRGNGRGCVLSDGRFAVFGGLLDDGDEDGERSVTSSCEVLTLDGDG
jgi:hypothetical protein